MPVLHFEEPLMGFDFVAECAFSNVVEMQLRTADEARAALLNHAGMHPVDIAAFQTLANDSTWIEHALTAARLWGPYGDSADAGEAAAKAYSRAAYLFGSES